MFDIFTQDVLNHVYEHWQNDKVSLAAETTIPGSFLFLRAVKKSSFENLICIEGNPPRLI